MDASQHDPGLSLLEWMVATQSDAERRFGKDWRGHRMFTKWIEEEVRLESRKVCKHEYAEMPVMKMLFGWRTDTRCKKCGELRSYVFESFDGTVRKYECNE